VAADALADYRELLRIAKNRPTCISKESEANELIKYLEACIAKVET
jgi:hypothetical protein